MSDEPEVLGHVRRMRRRSLQVVPKEALAEDGDEGASEDGTLPPHCPVRPIGVMGDVCFYLDQLGQLRELKARDHSRLNIMQMFGRANGFLYDQWPRKSQDKKTGEWETTGWKPELAAEALMKDCARLGVWAADEQVRGSGAWKGDAGELILHCGDELLMVAPLRPKDQPLRWSRASPGMVDGLVYPTAPPGLKPDHAVQPAGPGGPAAEVLALFETWKWRRPTIDPYLLIGWVAAAMLGGALEWRATAWITGSRNTGKSTLQKIVKNLLGPHGLMQTADASAASVRQTVKHDSRPVALDEAEAEEDDRKMRALIKLARDAASGSMSYRGGTDHQAVSFTVRSCFLFSSILVPPLLGQDRSRIAVLELDKIELTGHAKSMSASVRRMEELGGKLLRRLISQWWRFDDTLTAYRNALARAGHSARGQDVFGTLLCCADCLLSDVMPSDDVLAGWEGKLQATELAEIEGDVSDEDACLGHLLSTQLDNPHDRLRQSIGQWIRRAIGTPKMAGDEEEETRRKGASKVLLDAGLKIVTEDGEKFLAIANIHRGLTKIYETTHWASRSGAQGVWVQAIRRLPHRLSPKLMWFGSPSRATLIPITLCLPPEEDPAAFVLTSPPDPDGGWAVEDD